jgi:ABC-type branched-subunit amino acid transport system substrate-binding protein
LSRSTGVGRAVVVGCLLLLSALALAACGSSSSKTASSSAAAGSGTSNSGGAATGSPVKVMVIASAGTDQFNAPELWDVADDYAKQLNAAGGIKGHPIDVIACNDHNLPTGGTTCARDAVQQVGGSTYFGPLIDPIVAKANIPWIAMNGLLPQDLTSPTNFVVSPTQFVYSATGYMMVKEGCKKPEFISVNIPAGTSLLSQFLAPAIKAAGGSVAKSIFVPTQTTDLSAQAHELISDGDCAYVGFGEQQLLQIIQALGAAGSHLPLYTTEGVLTYPDYKQLGSAVEGLRLGLPMQAASTPAWQPYMKATAGVADQVSFIPRNTWLGMYILAKVAAAVPGDLTAAALFKQLNQTSNLNTEGMTRPLNFTKPLPDKQYARVFNPDVGFAVVKNGAEVAAYPGSYDASGLVTNGSSLVPEPKWTQVTTP